jgi:hypothetical protein
MPVTADNRQAGHGKTLRHIPGRQPSPHHRHSLSDSKIPVSLAVIMAHAASPSSCWMKSIAVAGAK